MNWCDQISDAATGAFKLFEPAWDRICELGYEPKDCWLDVFESRGATPFPDYRRVLKVRHQPVFEVTSTWRQESEWRFVCTHIDRLIEWPPVCDHLNKETP